MADKRTQSYNFNFCVELKFKTLQDILSMRLEKNFQIGCWNVRSLAILQYSTQAFVMLLPQWKKIMFLQWHFRR